MKWNVTLVTVYGEKNNYKEHYSSFFYIRNSNDTNSSFHFLASIWAQNVMKTAHAHSRDANAQRRSAGKCSCKIIIKIVRPKLNWQNSTSFRKIMQHNIS